MAASHLSWSTDHLRTPETGYRIKGAEPLSGEPWDTGAAAGGEDMPRKSLDKRFPDHPFEPGKGHSAPFSLITLWEPHAGITFSDIYLQFSRYFGAFFLYVSFS